MLTDIFSIHVAFLHCFSYIILQYAELV